MLRITVHDNPQALTFQLEGRLAGPWVQELKECWQSTLNQQRKTNPPHRPYRDDLDRRRGQGVFGGHALPRGRVGGRRLPDKRRRGRNHPLVPFRERRTHDDHLIPKEQEFNP